MNLSLLHLLWGAAPYEEVLAEVVCPAPLRRARPNRRPMSSCW